ncbi:XRE family transcriptional regulator [Agrobacterium tumefaciens]|uniref:DNA-binding protein n=2 Tax=Agrobacterium tumefaciens TaxID=358 RepID=A0A2L2L8Q4_AGRTU|nr:LexA family transcriptional regulator [Agrobacterium tumefaciens]AVH40636.1 DNA-binding protein [Agrobacterium tumefaciens]NSY94584.1 LexA family transcriptional regulator [Agrobacterium tumefaciens]
MNLGKKLIAARHAKRMTQAQIAEKLGVTVQAVSQWEKDRTIPGTANMRKLMGLLDIDLDANMSSLDQGVNIGINVSAPLIKEFPTIFFAEGEQDVTEDDWLDWDEMPFGKPVERLTINWEPIGNIFAITVKDMSMAPDFIEGDYLIIDSGMKVRPGALAFVQTRDPSFDSFLRKVRLTGMSDDGKRVMEIVPLNPDYPTLKGTEGIDFTITGGLREHRRVFKPA